MPGTRFLSKRVDSGRTFANNILAMVKSVQKHLAKAASSILVLGLILGLWLANLTASGRVLCIGSQGHIEWELAVHGVCADLESSVEHLECPDENDEHANEDHCGACIDIVLDGEIMTTHRRSMDSDFDFNQTFASSWVLPLFSADQASDDSSYRSKLGLPPSPPPAMLAIRSVILLI
jgi:hypothetical protein